MAKRFSTEFKQQVIEYALANSHEPLAAIARKLGMDYSTLDKWVRDTWNKCGLAGASKRQLTPEQQCILDLEKGVKQLREANDILKKRMCTFWPQIKIRTVYGNCGFNDEQESHYLFSL